MRIIAFMNQKGGVGKTTTTANLGAALAELGKRVCLIDLDPQAHLSINYGVDPNPELPSLYNILVDGTAFDDAVHKVSDRVSLVPSSIDLAAAEIELVSVPGRELLLKKRLEASKHQFDFMLLDCPPSLGLLTLNALAVAGEVLIPMQPHFLALQGVAKLLETVHLVSRRMNPRLKVTGVVLTMFDAQTKLSMEVVNELNGFIMDALGKPLPWASARVFDTRVRRNIKLAESPSFGKTILDYDSASNGAADYRSLARELLGIRDAATPAAAAKPDAAVAAPVRPNSEPTPAKTTAVAATSQLVAGAGTRAPAGGPAATKPAAPARPPPARPAAPAGPPPQRTGPIRPVPPAAAARGTEPASPSVSVTVNPDLDPSKLAAGQSTQAATPPASDKEEAIA